MNQTTKQLVKRSTCQWDCQEVRRLDQTPVEPQVCSTTVEGYPLMVIIFHSNIQGERGRAEVYLEVNGCDFGLDMTGYGIGVSSSMLARAEDMARRYIRRRGLPTPMPRRREVPHAIDIQP
jgi:hypothetical protein